MFQYILILAYDGTRFTGFQRQHTNAEAPTKMEGMKKRPRIDASTGQRQPLLSTDNKHVTVQECLECAILQWLEPQDWSLEQLNLRVAGRTDKGVHARGQVVAIQLPQQEECWKIQKGIHGRLPVDISIQRVIEVDLTTRPLFDPRQSAKHKQYSYTIKFQRRTEHHNKNEEKGLRLGPSYFRMALEDSPCLWSCHYILDDALMKQACQQLQGTHDYSAFVHKAARAEKDNTLTVTRFDLEILKEYQPPSLYMDANLNQTLTKDDEPQIVLARFYVEGDRFRRTMVRNLVGFVVDVGRGYQPLDCIESLWTGSKEAAARVPAAPAAGLCLEFVKF